MSQYLKEYDSKIAHSPMETLAKEELESAHRKIQHCTASLKEANEKIAKAIEYLDSNKDDSAANALYVLLGV
jgi:flagellar biosynthesis chaperone FliJ|tara:strand:- start:588 stop:803 length:216 start_codon:yes stop_codon:yes gene_type:complete